MAKGGEGLSNIGNLLGNAFIPETMARFRGMDQMGRSRLALGAGADEIMRSGGKMGSPGYEAKGVSAPLADQIFEGVGPMSYIDLQRDKTGSPVSAAPLLSEATRKGAVRAADPAAFDMAAVRSEIARLFPEKLSGKDRYMDTPQGVFDVQTQQLVPGTGKAPERAYKPGATRDIRVGSETVTQELQDDGTTWKQVARGAAFAPTQPQIAEFFDEETGRPYKAQLQPDGSWKRVGGISTPAKTFNNDQNKAAGFANSMANAETELTKITVPGTDGKAQQYVPNQAQQALEKMPGLGGAANLVASKEYQKYKQSAVDWTLALLRFESGANVPKEEAEKYWTTYFPEPGDKPETIQQKASSRAEKLKGVAAASGGAYDVLRGPPKAPAQAGSQATPPAATNRAGASGAWGGGGVVVQNGWRYDAKTHQPIGPVVK